MYSGGAMCMNATPGFFPPWVLLQLRRLLAVPVDDLELHASISLDAQAVIVLAVEEPQVHHDFLRVLGGHHRNHEGASTIARSLRLLGQTVWVKHVEVDNLATRQIGFRVMIA